MNIVSSYCYKCKEEVMTFCLCDIARNEANRCSKCEYQRNPCYECINKKYQELKVNRTPDRAT